MLRVIFKKRFIGSDAPWGRLGPGEPQVLMTIVCDQSWIIHRTGF